MADRDPNRVQVTVCPVTVNNNSGAPVTCRVVVTPLSRLQPPEQTTSHPRNNPTSSAAVNVISKVMLKAVSKDKKTLSKMFQLRNVNSKEVLSSGSLRSLIRAQLQDDVVSEYFDVGYMNGNNCVSIRNKEDLVEVWSNILSVVLWCDGLWSGGAKRKFTRDEEASAAKRSQVDKQEHVQEVVDGLKKQHGDKYTTMQYRLWGEMIVGGLYKSVTDAPLTSMFVRCGGGDTSSSKKGSKGVGAVVDAVQQLGVAMKTSSSGSNSSSPAKVIDSRSKCYKQLGELRV